MADGELLVLEGHGDLRELVHGDHLLRAQVQRLVEVRHHDAQDALHAVLHEHEGPRLLPVAPHLEVHRACHGLCSGCIRWMRSRSERASPHSACRLSLRERCHDAPCGRRRRGPSHGRPSRCRRGRTRCGSCRKGELVRARAEKAMQIGPAFPVDGWLPLHGIGSPQIKQATHARTGRCA